MSKRTFYIIASHKQINNNNNIPPPPPLPISLQEFMGLMGDHMVNLGEAKKEKEAKKQKSEQERQKQQEEAMRRELEKADPEVAKVLQNQEVAQILADPNMQKIMQECTQPGVLRKYMSDPVIAKKFRILQKHGLIQMHF